MLNHIKSIAKDEVTSKFIISGTFPLRDETPGNGWGEEEQHFSLKKKIQTLNLLTQSCLLKAKINPLAVAQTELADFFLNCRCNTMYNSTKINYSS